MILFDVQYLINYLRERKVDEVSIQHIIWLVAPEIWGKAKMRGVTLKALNDSILKLDN